ncbi:protein FAR1-RELATED SEQUENCE 9-like isoform X1 [Arachis ipaensis]|uniref:protein FAR1-RELATED SEQUENCE 9-like isoform X1 n=1 Tax=Arachis ipaensis TaxID=130454 RepID=UPI000A2AFC11|nr:protein FAR1-RELATED SEQUENCE 9-like isoform X1 [Arachis ipaensis]
MGFLNLGHSILELVQNLELVVREYRNNELVAQFNSIYSTPALTTCLDPIERCATDVYTRAIFVLVKKEIDGVGVVKFVSKRSVSITMVYTMEEYDHLGHYIVTLFDRTVTIMECQCRFWEKEDFLCRHMFFVTKHEHLKDILNRLILKLWRRDAKAIKEYVDDMLSERGFLLRHGALHAASQWMFYLGSKNRTVFKNAMERIRGICTDIHARLGQPNEGRKANGMRTFGIPLLLELKALHGPKAKRERKGDVCSAKGPATQSGHLLIGYQIDPNGVCNRMKHLSKDQGSIRT